MDKSKTLPKRPYLTSEEAAEYLRCSVDTLRRRVTRREIPYYKPGRALMFDGADLDAYMAASRFEAVDAWDL